MEKRIIREAIKLPGGIFRSRKLNEISRADIEKVLIANKLISIEERIFKNLIVRNAIYVNMEKSKTREELIKNCLKNLENEKIITSEIVNDTVVRRIFEGNGSIELFKKFRSGKLLVDDKKRAENDIISTVIEVVSFYNAIENGNVEEGKNIKDTIEILENNFEYGEIELDRLKHYQKVRNLKHNSLRSIAKYFKDSKPYKAILDIYKNTAKGEEIINDKKECSFEDDLFDILNGGDKISDNKSKDVKKVKKELDIREKNISKKDEKREKIELKPKGEVVKKEYKDRKTDKVIKKETGNDLDKSFRLVAKELGYHVIKGNKCEEEDSKIDILKELASIKKGAVLSELYNVYTDINKQSIDNIEAAMGNFFNKLRVLGFEADEENEIGEDIIVNTKDALDKFVFSSPVSEKGEVIGSVKYRAWNYKGKKVTPIIIDVITD